MSRVLKHTLFALDHNFISLFLSFFLFLFPPFFRFSPSLFFCIHCFFLLQESFL
ncbi:uncharacterized protein DS421_9g268700 [Arachis hypogaea]|nr:uncharacterized protein DS421_9g268700 [Arachis hypogaea]